jgi:hypothetical protein
LKTLLIICAAVLLLQSFTLWKAHSADGQSEPSPEDVEKGDWKPGGNVPPLASKGEAALDRFRPRIKLPWEERRVAPNVAEPVDFEHGNKDGRVAKFRLTEGTAMRIAYDNPRSGELNELCLCADGGLAGVMPLPSCGKGFRIDKCATEGQIVVYGEQGKFLLQGLGRAGGTIRQY